MERKKKMRKINLIRKKNRKYRVNTYIYPSDDWEGTIPNYILSEEKKDEKWEKSK